ncbi:TolC family protein [bacterium]|nr:TolC family protein [bacterium]
MNTGNSYINKRWFMSAIALSLGMAFIGAESVWAEPASEKPRTVITAVSADKSAPAAAASASADGGSSDASERQDMNTPEASAASTGLPYTPKAVPEPSAAAASSAEDSPSPLLPDELADNPNAPTYTMHQAIDIAVKNSPELRAARAAYEQAKGGTEEAYTAGSPKVDFTAGYIFTVPEAKASMGEQTIVIGHQHNYSLGLSLTQVISTFGRLHYSVLASQMNEYMALEQYRQALEAKWASAANRYLNVLLAKEAVVIAMEQLSLREASLKQAQDLEAGGMVAHFDVLTMQAAKASADVTLIEAKNALRLARAALCSEMGLPADAEFNLVIPDRNKIPKDAVKNYNLRQSVEEAYVRRPEVQALRWAEEAARARLEVSRNSRNPTLALNSEVSNTRSSSMASGTTWVTSIVFAVPIYDAGTEKAQSKQLEAALEQIDANLESAKRGVRLDVEQCYYNLDSRWQRLEQAKITLEQSEEAYRVAEIRYGAGLSTTTELLDAQSTLVAAKRGVATAMYSYLGANIDWALATSGAYPAPPVGPIDVSDLKTDLDAWYVDVKRDEAAENGGAKLIDPVKDDNIPSFPELKVQVGYPDEELPVKADESSGGDVEM